MKIKIIIFTIVILGIGVSTYLFFSNKNTSYNQANTKTTSQVNPDKSALTYKLTSSSTLDLYLNNNLIQTIKEENNFINLASQFERGTYEGDLINNTFDINFDGIKDLALLTGIGYSGQNICYDFYVYDKANNKYLKVPELESFCNPSVDNEKKTISTSAKDGPGYYTTIVQYKDGKFITLVKEKQLTQ